MADSALRRRLGVMAVRCQASSLLGRLETLGPTASSGRPAYFSAASGSATALGTSGDLVGRLLPAVQLLRVHHRLGRRYEV
jgi:hypothetical protein